MKYAFCSHDIERFDKVLFVYPEGDCDTGTIHDFDPFDNFGTVQVYLDSGLTLSRQCVEDVSHFYCDEE